MDKLLCIVGPTASGKTKLAIKMAQKWNGVLVNCDSVQVYKGLDIISGKDLNVIKTTPIALIDIVPPTYDFNVSDFVGHALAAIDSILKKDKLPILVGGTGFYLKALIDGVDTLNIPQNKNLRTELEQKNPADLSSVLHKENPQKLSQMNESDRKNKRRLIRAIEVTRYLNYSQLPPIKKPKQFDTLIVGLSIPMEKLKQRINERVEERLHQGALAEAQKLFEQYSKLSRQVKSADGYHALFNYLLAKTDLATAIDQWKLEDYHHAKKQMTWFKKDTRISWFDITQAGFTQEVEKTVKKWLQNG